MSGKPGCSFQWAIAIRMMVPYFLLCIVAGPVVWKVLAQRVILHSTASILQASRRIQGHILKRLVSLGNTVRRGDEKRSQLMV